MTALFVFMGLIAAGLFAFIIAKVYTQSRRVEALRLRQEELNAKILRREALKQIEEAERRASEKEKPDRRVRVATPKPERFLEPEFPAVIIRDDDVMRVVAARMRRLGSESELTTHWVRHLDIDTLRSLTKLYERKRRIENYPDIVSSVVTRSAVKL